MSFSAGGRTTIRKSINTSRERAFLVCAIACFLLIRPLIADADLSGKLVNAQLCALPAHGRAVQERGASRQRPGPDEHQAAGRWLQACRNLEDKVAPLAVWGVIQAAIR